MGTTGDQRPGLGWGSRIAYYREKMGISQAEMAAMTGISRVALGQIESGRIKITYPGRFNDLRKALHFPGWEVLEAMGFKTDAVQDNRMNPVLETYILQMDDEQQEAFAQVAKAFFRHLGPWLRTEPQHGASP